MPQVRAKGPAQGLQDGQRRSALHGMLAPDRGV